ncbi:MAG TPA: glycosyltransferase family 39 protein [Bacteroidales bacterium]|nr:glycosyltransferase family 39 protein [Bacteroidales bacterium]
MADLLKHLPDKTTRIYLLAGIVFLLTAWFSTGYNHFDEHFQVIEFAALKLGLIKAADLPWEYGCRMRPALQPLVVCALYKIASPSAIANPFFVAFLVRLFSALLTFYSIHLVIRLYSPWLASRQLRYALLLLSFFLWFVPYNGARFASETLAGRIFLAGMALFFLQKDQRAKDYLFNGIVLGFAFVVRYQCGFMVAGYLAWLLLVRRSGLRNAGAFCAGLLVALATGILVDRWFYGEWVLTSWNYFSQNLLQGKASTFGTGPWWYYIEQTLINAFPPLSLVYIAAVFLYFYYYPKDVITWVLVPFLAAHFLIPHKEIRFLFPVIGFLPVMIVRVLDAIGRRNGYSWLEGRAFRISRRVFWSLNSLMLILLIFRPADDGIALYRTLWNRYDKPARLCFSGDNPYHRAKVDIHFYKRPGLALTPVDSLSQVVPVRDTVTLLVTPKPLVVPLEGFSAELVYSTYPQWVRHFNFNHWMDRTSFWHVYEIKPAGFPIHQP